ncbi:MAG: hypothetical protein KF910_11595 [Brevundimonas sp.]|uniref:tetratricopeptide repeat protein n=1 Tax=Brevundimonas sp. TaxID=1871086 RepID=UPI0025BF53E5|nr:hypothetical protein [Brevundimonas sp.]MBX3478245.1 hypothetical protein [Brevundimonas sp.]
MSGARQTKRVLKATAAAAAAGAVALSPLAPLAQEAAAGGAPIDIRVGSNPGFTRVEFGGAVGSRSRIRQDGRQVIVRLGSTAAPDVSRLRVDPPQGVTAVETRAISGATELVLTLAEGAAARSGAADGVVWLNLYSPDQAPAAPQTLSPAALAPVRATASADKAVLTFDWTTPVGAAVFRRGAAVWIVFDAAARMDFKGATNLGPAGGARWAAGPDYTVVRVAAPENLAVSATADGGRWTVTLGGAPRAASGVEVMRDPAGTGALVGRMAGARRAIWLTDPMVGDRFAAVTAVGPAKGFPNRRETVDLTLMPTAQGLAVESRVGDLAVAADGDLVTLARPGGLRLSAPSAALETAAPDRGPRKAGHPGLILAEWKDAGPGGFGARYRDLQMAAAEETIRAGDDPRAPVEARMALARFLVGSGLAYEAIGVLNAVAKTAPGMLGEPELRGLRGAARAQIGRLDEAQADFSAAAVAGDPATKVWLGYIAAEHGDWAGARQAFAAGASVIDSFPAEWRARFGAAHALAALETGDLTAAETLLAYSFSQNAPAADQLAARLVQARMFELQGQGDRAERVYQAVARAPLDAVATPARLGLVRIGLAKGTMKPDAAAAELESLKWRWRGDATELAVIRTLGELYLSQGRYREALDALRGAGKRMAQMPGAADIQQDLSEAFKSLFLDGAADGLQPIQALALFYDFRELTPVGADGDEMVRRLARRLIDVDLLKPAAELLKYQADNRLEGVAKAQVATDLAAVYLMDRQPEAALQAIWGSRSTLLPNAMNAERRALEARALMELGRYDHALELLERDNGPAAREVRADVFWKQEKWGQAAALYEARLGERYKDGATPLTPDEEARLLRAGVGYSLARDAGALARLSRNWRPFVAGARNADGLRIALDGLDGMGGTAEARDFAALASGVDTFNGWVAGMKAQIRQKTGGSRPAAPARPASSAPTPARPAA